MVDLSIIIPAYNEEAYLPNTLASVSAATAGLPATVEVVVVDNNSDDRTGEIARAMGATVVREPVNQIARARNTGARAAAGKFFIFLDADTSLSAPLLESAVANLASGRIVGGGATVAPDRPLDSSGKRVIRFWNGLSKRFHIAAGSFVYCLREAFEAVGGFDERVYASEEIWLSIRLNRWARRRGMRFAVIETWPVVTSIRKLDWFSPARLVFFPLLVTLFPFALFSRRLCHLWYYRPASERVAPGSDPAEIPRNDETLQEETPWTSKQSRKSSGKDSISRTTTGQ